MATGMPWGTPTVSDATKLGIGVTRRSTIYPTQPAGTIYQLLVQLITSDNFPNLNNWIETDSGGNVNLAGGVVSLNGSGAWSANGIYWAIPWDHSDNEPSCFEIKGKNIKRNFIARIGAHNAAAWPGINGQRLGRLESTVINVASQFRAYSSYLSKISDNLDNDVFYTIRVYHFPTQAEDMAVNSYYGTYLLTLEGGDYAVETVVAMINGQDPWNSATVSFHIERFTNDGATLLQVKEFRYYHGLPIDGPTLTFVCDAGAGKVIDTFDLTNLAPVGGWATTNVTFAWSFDDGVAAYSAEHTLAAMNAHGVQAGRHRYARLRITVNSDGATQQYAGEVNSVDATLGIGDFPEVNNTYLQDTVQLVAGTLTNPTERPECLTTNILAVNQQAFTLGDTVYVNGTLEFVKALAAANVRVRVYNDAGVLQATLFNAAYNFLATTAATLTAINGGVMLQHVPALADGYYVEIVITHADLPNGALTFFSGFGVAAAGGGGGGSNQIRAMDPDMLHVR